MGRRKRKVKDITTGEIILSLLPFYKNFRDHRLYKIWKKGALRIFRNRCPISHETDDLDVHHMADAKNHPHLRYDPFNGIPLLTEYHKGFHKWNGGSRNKCTKSDLIRWLSTADFPQKAHERRARRLAKTLASM